MRPLVVVALLASCTSTTRCKPGTALVRITLPTPGPFTLLLSLGGAPDKMFDEIATHTSETIEVDFPGSYPAGKNLTVTVDAGELGFATVDYELEPTCSVIDLVVGPPDMAESTDGVRPIGARCAPGDVCGGGGQCVDGRCCESACSGQCEACDVSGMEGKCVPVLGPPHSSRPACNGDSGPPCGGSCDGTNPDACSYPTDVCSPASCTGGVATLPKLCSSGSCPTPPPDTQTCRLGCSNDTCLGVKQLAAGYSFACATLTDGTVRCWGDNSTKQLGSAAVGLSKVPIAVAGLTNVQMVAATFSGACALLGDGTVTCWGNNNATPAARTDISGASFINGSSGGHYCAIVAGGELRCWGNNSAGQLGDGTNLGQMSAVAVCAPGSTMLPCTHMVNVTHVRGGDDHTCAVAAGSVACWGGNDTNQLGVPGPSANPFPQPVPSLAAATSVAAGNRISCAAANGEAKCWGSNDADRLGSNQVSTGLLPPASVCTNANCSSLLGNVTGISTVDESNCAITSLGEVRCWGHNGTSQLGDGSTSSTKASQGNAATITIASGAVDIIAGGGSNYAIMVDRADRYVLGWGADSSGELGDNSVLMMPSPAPVEPKWQ